MFTGLVESVGDLVERASIDEGCRLRFASALARDLRPGDSIAVNGVCLTVVTADADAFTADVGPETVRVTTLGVLQTGARVNLERPLRPDSRMGGHFVQGHVDAIGRVEDLRAAAGFQWLTVSFPRELAAYFVPKGSVAVDGISLTVARLGVDRFDVQVVPFTIEHTNLSRMRARDPVNLECDMVGKYVVRMAELAGVTLSGGRAGEAR